MFFVLSKILSFLFTPLTWILTLLLLSFSIKKTGLKKRLLLISIITFLFFSNRFIAEEFMRLWEPAHVSQNELKTHYDAALVMGGGMITYDAKNQSSTFRHNTDRILQTVKLYHQGRVDKIIISGGSGNLKYRNMLEAPLLKSYFTEIGIAENDIWIDSLSDNTYQNAVNTSKILNDSLPNGSFLLVTSASHMKRTNACFLKQGIECDLYPVDFNTGTRNWHIMNLIKPDTEAFKLWEELLHEISGYLIYSISGYL